MTPMQLVFGRDIIWNTKFNADWDYIRQQKQQIINQNNVKEKAQHIPYAYQVGNNVLMKVAYNTKYSGLEYDEPYPIITVNANGTVRIRKNKYYEIVDIRNLNLYALRMGASALYVVVVYADKDITHVIRVRGNHVHE